MNSTPVPEAPSLDPSDPVLRQLTAAVALAREAAEEVAGQHEVGEHVGLSLEDAAAATHLFDADTPGYRGWCWAVTVASAGVGYDVTVSEVVLLPGPDALVAPEWVPWQERVQAGDLGVGDLMPTAPDDPRLVPGYLGSDDSAIEDTAHELGLGRVRVMGRAARLDAAARWRGGEFGPRSDMARGAPGHCVTCGFYLPLAGSLSAAFGVCANEIAPADGHLVHAEYGCGAHSEAEVEQVSPVLVADLIYDDDAMLDIELIDRTPPPAATPPAVKSADVAAPSVSVDSGVAERPPVAPAPSDVAAEPAPVESAVVAGPARGAEVAEPASALVAEPGPGADAVERSPVASAPSDMVPEPAPVVESAVVAEPAQGVEVAEPPSAVRSDVGLSSGSVDSGVAERSPVASEPSDVVAEPAPVESAVVAEPAQGAEVAEPPSAVGSDVGAASGSVDSGVAERSPVASAPSTEVAESSAVEPVDVAAPSVSVESGVATPAQSDVVAEPSSPGAPEPSAPVPSAEMAELLPVAEVEVVAPAAAVGVEPMPSAEVAESPTTQTEPVAVEPSDHEPSDEATGVVEPSAISKPDPRDEAAEAEAGVAEPEPIGEPSVAVESRPVERWRGVVHREPRAE